MWHWHYHTALVMSSVFSSPRTGPPRSDHFGWRCPIGCQAVDVNQSKGADLGVNLRDLAAADNRVWSTDTRQVEIAFESCPTQKERDARLECREEWADVRDYADKIPHDTQCLADRSQSDENQSLDVIGTMTLDAPSCPSVASQVTGPALSRSNISATTSSKSML
jgi:hypothetical protein